MGIADFFRPKHRHSDVRVRTEAVRALTSDDTTILVQIARTDRDPSVRRIAIEKLEEAELLADIAKAEEDRALRDLAGERAAELWIQIACDEDDEVGAVAALDGLIGLDHQHALATVAVKAAIDTVRRRASGAISDPRALAELARTSGDASARLDAVARIDDQDALRALAVDTPVKEVGIAAVDALDDGAALEIIAQKAKAKQVRQRARKKLADREEAAAKAKPAVADDVKRRRAEKAQALRHMEHLAETFDWDKAEGEVAKAEADWAAIGDAGDGALDEKFAKLVKRYRDRRDVHFAKLEEARHQHAAPPREEPRRERPRDPDDVDVVAPAHAAVLAAYAQPDPAREARQKEAAARREERDRARADEDARRAQESADREARKSEMQERGKQIALSLDALCADLEGMFESDDQRAVQRLLDQAGKAFEQIGKVAPGERDALEARYGAARAKLVIKLKDLRETEDWARWANVPRQEALIKEAEALAAAEAPTLPALQELQKRWKTVGPTPQNKSKELWERFKTAADAAFAKIRGARDVEKAQWDQNLAAREQLITQAEALAESTDWEATAEQLKGLQAQWKASGPVPRKQGDLLWKRFRAACDRFFERRKPMLDARNAEFVENLERKQALCAKVEAIVEAAPGDGGWGAAITAVKRAQQDWRDVGFVPRKDADAIYARFRAACDALFAKRDAARDAEALAERAELDALRGEIEAAVALAEGAGAKAIAIHGTLRALAERGLAAGAELAASYERLLRHAIATDAAGLRGSDLDPEAVARKLEKLVVRAQELLPREAPAPSAGESAEDVAAKLRAALKSNALGGVRWQRDPRELVDELRAEWAAAGPVISEAAQALRARFDEVCAAVIAAAGGEREREPAREERGDRGDRGDRDGRRRERRQRRSREGEDRVRSAHEQTPATAVPEEGLAAIAAAAGRMTGVPEAPPATPPRVTDPIGVAAPATPIAIAGPSDITTPARIVPEPMPAPPVLPARAPTSPPTPARARSITTPPPADPIDDTWSEDAPAVDAAPAPAAKPRAPESQPPAAGEMAGDGATEGDGIDAGWD
jgi:hypothetical protein